MARASQEKLTPMMQQYVEVKQSLPPGTLLLFRLGDFYEMFNEDAEDGARILGITLTRRHEMPMAGVPFHAVDSYASKLLAAGRKVALCDQLEPATPGKLVKRELTRILSPGTTLEEGQLEAGRNRWLCALSSDRQGFHASWLDLSTGEFQLATAADPSALLPALTALDPRELILPEGLAASWHGAPHDATALHAMDAFCSGRALTELPAWQFEAAAGAKTVMDALGVLNLEGFGLRLDHPALGAAGAVLAYATEHLRATPGNLRALREHRSGSTLLLDPATLRNLEIFESARGGRESSLIAAIDRCQTAPGHRLLERWLAAPPLDLAEIRRRHEAVGGFAACSALLPDLQAALGEVRDIPRILGRMQNRLRNPRELGGVRDTLRQVPGLRSLIENAGDARLSALAAGLHDFPGLRELLDGALNDELPAAIEDGGAVRPGYDPELDRLHGLTSGNKAWLSGLERTEQERTGIRSLKVRYNQAFGYFIEVTKANLHLVPADYIRRSTTVNGERYITDELRKKEKEILHAEENALARETELFQDLVARSLEDAAGLQALADTLAEIDVLSGWAVLAREWNYCRPEVDDSSVLEITGGRHPVVEQMLKAAPLGLGGSHAFVPNDTRISCEDEQILLLTGPNMAGKSTYIRQVALITLMAQTGCWVPADACRTGLVDRIFSRVGASDDLARGNSTFMVEMNETANILNHCTGRSLIVLDEIGRGTSTYDGLSIAWAVVEHLHQDPARGPRTLFATHYLELTQLAGHLPRLRNHSVAVKEWNDEIVFVRRVVPGPADRSYGIQVARLAGLPRSVIDRARVILEKLESDDATIQIQAPAPQVRPKRKITVRDADSGQLDLL